MNKVIQASSAILFFSSGGAVISAVLETLTSLDMPPYQFTAGSKFSRFDTWVAIGTFFGLSFGIMGAVSVIREKQTKDLDKFTEISTLFMGVVPFLSLAIFGSKRIKLYIREQVDRTAPYWHYFLMAFVVLVLAVVYSTVSEYRKQHGQPPLFRFRLTSFRQFLNNISPWRFIHGAGDQISNARKPPPWWLFAAQVAVIAWLIVDLFDPMDFFTSWVNPLTISLSIAFCVLMHFISQHYKD